MFWFVSLLSTARSAVRSLGATGDERGAGLVEYALLIALITMVCIAAVGLLGSVTGDQYSSVTSGFQ